jgi:hypothetical protein
MFEAATALAKRGGMTSPKGNAKRTTASSDQRQLHPRESQKSSEGERDSTKQRYKKIPDFYRQGRYVLLTYKAMKMLCGKTSK